MIGNQIQDNSEHDKDGKHNAGCPGEHITRFGTEGGLPTRTAKGAGQAAASSFLDEDQEDQNNAHEDEGRHREIKQHRHGRSKKLRIWLLVRGRWLLAETIIPYQQPATANQQPS
jgi:hypothetical protein